VPIVFASPLAVSSCGGIRAAHRNIAILNEAFSKEPRDRCRAMNAAATEAPYLIFNVFLWNLWILIPGWSPTRRRMGLLLPPFPPSLQLHSAFLHLSISQRIDSKVLDRRLLTQEQHCMELAHRWNRKRMLTVGGRWYLLETIVVSTLIDF
jgi:hypothetical protein